MKENWVYRRGDLYLANLGVFLTVSKTVLSPTSPIERKQESLKNQIRFSVYIWKDFLHF